MSCGACCADFRAAFHWLETESPEGSGVPLELTETLDAHRLVMKAARGEPVRCVALDVDIGRRAICTIYARRPGVCREVNVSGESGRISPQCDRVRIAHGLPVLTPAEWVVSTPEIAANEAEFGTQDLPVAV